MLFRSYTQSIDSFADDSDFTTGYLDFVKAVSEELKKRQPQEADEVSKLKARIEDLEIENGNLIEDAVKDSETIADLMVTNQSLKEDRDHHLRVSESWNKKLLQTEKNLDNFIAQSRKDIEFANKRNNELRAKVDVVNLQKKALEEQLQGCVSADDLQSLESAKEREANEWESLVGELSESHGLLQFGIEELLRVIRHERSCKEEMPF